MSSTIPHEVYINDVTEQQSISTDSEDIQTNEHLSQSFFDKSYQDSVSVIDFRSI